MRVGAIVAEPGVSDRERWGTACGPEMYPFVRHLGGVSLFEFNNFNPKIYAETYSLSMWQAFVPYIEKWGESLWLEIDIGQLGPSFVPGHDLLARWKEEKCHSRKIMPLIEAASLAPVPVSAIQRKLISSRESPALTAWAQ